MVIAIDQRFSMEDDLAMSRDTFHCHNLWEGEGVILVSCG